MLKFLILFKALSTFMVCCRPFKENAPNVYEKRAADLSYLGVRVFTQPNQEVGYQVDKWDRLSEVNPEELGGYLEGDILSPKDIEKNGLIAETARWPHGEVPFEINGYFSNKEKEIIKNAMLEYHKNTCIRFRRRTLNDSSWISLTSSYTGCWSTVGRTGGKQDVNLQLPNCLARIGTVIHELLHALGFHHEQNRWERDSYVAINWENIQRGKEANFKKANKSTVSGFGGDYDYGSVMHYSEKAFSVNGGPTITVITDTPVKIGQRQGFSSGDLRKINSMYNCSMASNNEHAGVDINTNENQNGGVIGELVSILFPT